MSTIDNLRKKLAAQKELCEQFRQEAIKDCDFTSEAVEDGIHNTLELFELWLDKEDTK